MKKVYAVGLLLMTAGISGCAVQNTSVVEVSTGTVQELTETGQDIGTIEFTETIMTGDSTGEIAQAFDSGVVPMVAGSETITNEQSGVSAEVKTLIDTLPQDKTGIIEEDVDLRQKTIDIIKNIGK